MPACPQSRAGAHDRKESIVAPEKADEAARQGAGSWST
jgi:hypothetical protein